MKNKEENSDSFLPMPSMEDDQQEDGESFIQET
jgi:hypothetical protein